MTLSIGVIVVTGENMLTVVFSTFNGASTLPLMLEGCAALDPPDGGWEIIAVDNGSTDESHEILSGYLKRLPLHILYQEKRGKNVALNAAIPFFQGDLVVFTDDDVVPAQDWLTEYRRAMTMHPDVAIFGGAVLPRWPVAPSRWILDYVDIEMAFAVTSPTLRDGPILPGFAFGPNMAVNRIIFDQGIRFDEGIGPSAGNYIMGGETDFNDRVAALGYQCRHVPGAIVEHLIRLEQMSPEWLMGRAFRSGRAVGRRDALAKNNKRLPALAVKFPMPQFMLFLKIEALKYCWSARGNSEQALRCQYHGSFFRGYIAEWRSTIVKRRCDS
jgi:glycosyltransferase involved in cell wall biosynthesis